VNSISVVALSPYFLANDIILAEDQVEILSIPSSTKAAGLLLCKISSALKAGVNASFHKFLDITEQYGSIDSKNVTSAIRKRLLQLKSENKGNSL